MPVLFEWKGRIYRVRDVQEMWRFTEAWWDKESEYTFFRVRTDKGGIYELRFDHGKKQWSLSAIRD